MLVGLLYLHLSSINSKGREGYTIKQRTNLGKKSKVYLWLSVILIVCEASQSSRQMAGAEVEELVVHLEKSIDLSNMEQGIKLVGTVLAKKILHK